MAIPSGLHSQITTFSFAGLASLFHWHNWSCHCRIVSLPYWHISKLPHSQIFKLIPYLRYTFFEFARAPPTATTANWSAAEVPIFNRGSCNRSCRWPDVLWTGMTTAPGSTSPKLEGGRLSTRWRRNPEGGVFIATQVMIQ